MTGAKASLIALFACTLAVSGCSYAFDVVATFDSGGRLVLRAEESGWSILRPDICITSLAVYSEDPLSGGVAPPQGNWLGRNGLFVWSFQPANRTSNPCIGDFPIRYGQAPAGAAVTVKARRLRPDIVYVVYASGPGQNGGGRFRLKRAVRVENLDT